MSHHYVKTRYPGAAARTGVAMNVRTLAAEALGTACLVFVGVGVATLTFGFALTGPSASAGVVATALAFGLVMLILAYAIGPVSGAHINPAVTIGFLLAGRISLADAVGYWVAQIVGGIAGAAVLRGLFAGADGYSTASQGMGTNSWGTGRWCTSAPAERSWRRPC